MLPKAALDFIRNDWPRMLRDPHGYHEEQVARAEAIRTIWKINRDNKFPSISGLTLAKAMFVDILVRSDWQPGDTVILRNIEGMARKSGTDEHGNRWIEFEVDYLADQEPGECAICEAEIESGWLCLDGGDEVCNHHVMWWKDWVEREK